MSRKLSRVRLPRGRGAPWPLALAVSVGLLAASRFLFGLFDGTGPLGRWRDRAVGVTTLEAVDASGYAQNYVWMISIFAVAFFLVFIVLRLVDHALRRAAGPALIAGEYSLIERLSELAIVLVVMRLVVADDFLLTLVAAVYHLIVLLFLLIAVKIAVDRRRGDGALAALLAAVLADRGFLTAALFLPFPFLFSYWIVFAKPIAFGALSLSASFALYALALALLLAARCAALRRWTAGPGAGAGLARRVRAANARLIFAAAPLVLVPLAVPVANELQYNFPDTAPRRLALLLTGALAGASVVLFLLHRRRPWRMSPQALLDNFYFPVFVATAVVFRVHRHVRHMGELDYFHTGEITVPTQQLFNFSSIPLIDLRLAHTLSDLFYQSLYTLINGYHGMDMLVWVAWMPEVVTFVLLYFFIARLVSPPCALLAVSLAPVMGSVSEYYAFALVPPLALAGAVRRPTGARFALVWLSAVGLTLWRFDFGVAVWTTLFVVLAVYLARRPDRLRAAAASLAAVAGACLAVLGVLALLSHRPVWETLAFLVKSYTFRMSTRTRAAIIDEYGMAAVLQYYVLPAVSLVYVLYFAVRRLAARGYLRAGQYMPVFLAVFSLIISLRSLERHSLIERFNPYLFVFLLALLPFFLRGTGVGRESAAARAVFFGVLVLNAFFWLPPSNFAIGRYGLSHVFKPGPLFEFHDWEEGERRVFYEAERHEDLVAFLDDHLAGDETFFDFTNSPLLFVLADKQFPTYVIPNFIQTSETVQGDVVADLAGLHRAGRLPFVVFKQGNPYWDNVDGVANEVRSYRVAEWIYRHYEPLANVGKYQVWSAAAQRERESLMADCASSHALEPGERPRGNGVAVVREDADPRQVTLRASGGDPSVSGLFRLAGLPALSERAEWSLLLRYRSSAAGDLQVFYQTDGAAFSEEASAWASVHTAESPREALLPVTVPAAAGHLTDVRLDPPAGSTLTIEGGVLFGTDRSCYPVSQIELAQSFRLLQLPRVWAEYDPLGARSRTEVLAELLQSPAALGEGRELTVSLDPSVDKASGNYLHLRMAPKEPFFEPAASRDVRVLVEYGAPPESSFELTVTGAVEQSRERYPLPRRTGHASHNLESFMLDERVIYRAAGDDPYVHQLFDLAGVPALHRADALYLDLQYRSSAAGRMQVYFAFNSSWFEARDSRWVEIRQTSEHGEPREVAVAFSPPRDYSRLTDLRLDPPDDSMIEVVKAEIVKRTLRHDDYLVRLSTQWEWMSQPVDSLRLTASAPVAVERILLRRGD